MHCLRVILIPKSRHCTDLVFTSKPRLSPSDLWSIPYVKYMLFLLLTIFREKLHHLFRLHTRYGFRSFVCRNFLASLLWVQMIFKSMLVQRILQKNFKSLVAESFEYKQITLGTNSAAVQMSSFQKSVLRLLYGKSMKDSKASFPSFLRVAEFGVVVPLAFKRWTASTDFDAAKTTLVFSTKRCWYFHPRLCFDK